MSEATAATGEATGSVEPEPAGGARKPTYRRILLKLSGEALLGSRQYGVDPNFCAFIAAQVAEVHELGVEIGIVVGGGNIFRGLAAAAKGMDRATGDYIGMLATVMNALALQDALEKAGVPTRVMSAIGMNEIAEPYIRRRAVRHLEKGRVIILAAGTGNPYFTTDTAAALRAVEIGAEVILKATKVDGVYDSDPITNPGAKRYDRLTYAQMLAQRLGVLDATAVSLCMENDTPIIVFDLNKPENITRVATGEVRRHPDHRRQPLMSSGDVVRHRTQDDSGGGSSGARPAGRFEPVALRRRSLSGSWSTLRIAHRRSIRSPAINVPEAHQIVIQPWDRNVLGAIEKAITKSDIGLVPNMDGTVVRLNIPPLTEERRRDLVKQVHKRMEEARVEIRNLRRTPPTSSRRKSTTARQVPTRGGASTSSLQRITDKHVGDVDRVGATKEQEILEV